MDTQHMPVPAGEFWKAFARCLRAAVEKQSEWYGFYSADKSWTAFIREVVRETCGNWQFGLVPGSYTLEDFRVDFCCFSFSPPEQCTEQQNWDLEVAVEHENNGRSWLHEWLKLAHLNCGLRVVISYSDDPRAFMKDSELMDRAIRLAQARRYAPRTGNWLLVLGPTLKALRTEGNDFTAFSFDGSVFRMLDDIPVLRYAHWPN